MVDEDEAVREQVEEVLHALEENDGFVIQMWLPSGRHLGMMPLSFGQAQLGIGEPPPLEKAGLFADYWHYPSWVSAMQAYATFDEQGEEPTGWHRHPPTGRYRIEADPQREYVKDMCDQFLVNIIGAVKTICGGERIIRLEDVVETTDKVIGPSFPKGTRHLVVTSTCKGEDHIPCLWVDRVFHYLDRSVVVSIQDLPHISVGQIIDRLTSPLFPRNDAHQLAATARREEGPGEGKVVKGR